MGSWPRTHRKKIITHTAIIVGFVLFTIFVSAPLFDRLVSGEAQLHRLQLPAETTNMRYQIDDILTDSHTGVEIVGWTFVDGQDCQNRELYIVLKSAQQTYVFDTKVGLRSDLLRINKEFGEALIWNLDYWGFRTLIPACINEKLVSNADYSGFRTLIPAREISNGEYIVGFYTRSYLNNRVIEALYYTDKVVIKSQDSVTWGVCTSKLVEITLPEESGNIQCSLIKISDVTYVDQLFEEMSGWAFIPGCSTKDSRTYVVLKSDTNTYVFDTIPTYVWGLARQLGNYSWDLDYSGFIARIPKNQLGERDYQVGIYIAHGDIQVFRYTAVSW